MKAIQYPEVAPAIFDTGEAKRVAIRVAIGKADGAASFLYAGFRDRRSDRLQMDVEIISGSARY